MGLLTDQWKSSLDDYVKSAQLTFDSMLSHGFIPGYAIQIDPERELLDGSHRLAAALALWMENVPVVISTKRVWAPPWGYDWFVAKEIPKDDLERMVEDWEFLTQ